MLDENVLRTCLDVLPSSPREEKDSPSPLPPHIPLETFPRQCIQHSSDERVSSKWTVSVLQSHHMHCRRLLLYLRAIIWIDKSRNSSLVSFNCTPLCIYQRICCLPSLYLNICDNKLLWESKTIMVSYHLLRQVVVKCKVPVVHQCMHYSFLDFLLACGHQTYCHTFTLKSTALFSYMATHLLVKPKASC